jgi:hypothetical protein
VFAPTQPGVTGQPGSQTQQQRFQGTVTPGNQGPTILRGGNNPQLPQGQTQGQTVDPRFRGQMGNQTVVPQGQTVVPQAHTVTPQFQQGQPRVVTPPPQNRTEQDRRGAGGNPN